MKRKKLNYTLGMILCAVIFTASCITLALGATSQAVTSSLSVTFDGQNVNYTVQGWYQVAGSDSRTALKDSSNTSNAILNFSAMEQSTTKTLAVVENGGVVNLTANNTYVLLTYKFSNTATVGAYGMEISLTGSASSDSNISVKYLASANDYTATSSGVNEQSALVTSSTAFDHVFVRAGQTKYLYILISLVDVCLNGTYNKSSGMSFSVTCSSYVEEPVDYTVTFESDGPDYLSYLKYQITNDGVNYNENNWETIPSTVSVPSGKRLHLKWYYVGSHATIYTPNLDGTYLFYLENSDTLNSNSLLITNEITLFVHIETGGGLAN